MKLKSVLDTLDGLDDALKGYYTEKDGKFYLAVDGYEPNEIETIRTAMRRAKEEKAEAVRELRETKDRYAGLPDDFTVDEFNRLKDGGSGNVDQKLENQRARMTKEKDTAVKTVTDERDLYRGMVTRMATDAAINTAMAESNITIPAHQKAVRAMFGAQAKVDFENDVPVVTIENVPVTEKIKSYATSDEGKYFVSAPANAGGGSGGQGGSGMKDYGKMTNTELALAQDKDPAAKAEMDRRTKIEKPERR